jgi:hypothetical protein
MRLPPAVPTVRFLPGGFTKAGFILDNIRSPGAIELTSLPNKPETIGTAGLAEKSSISSFSSTILVSSEHRFQQKILFLLRICHIKVKLIECLKMLANTNPPDEAMSP